MEAVKGYSHKISLQRAWIICVIYDIYIEYTFCVRLIYILMYVSLCQQKYVMHISDEYFHLLAALCEVSAGVLRSCGNSVGQVRPLIMFILFKYVISLKSKCIFSYSQITERVLGNNLNISKLALQWKRSSNN